MLLGINAITQVCLLFIHIGYDVLCVHVKTMYARDYYSLCYSIRAVFPLTHKRTLLRPQNRSKTLKVASLIAVREYSIIPGKNVVEIFHGVTLRTPHRCHEKDFTLTLP